MFNRKRPKYVEEKLKLKDEILDDIKFDEATRNLYQNYNGCKNYRMECADKLANAIRFYHQHPQAINTNDKIAKPNKELMLAVKKVAKNGEMNNLKLDNTLASMGKAIDAHIAVANQPRSIQQTYLKQIAKEIKNEFLNEKSAASFDIASMNYVLEVYASKGKSL